jgi:hypothetical protein
VECEDERRDEGCDSKDVSEFHHVLPAREESRCGSGSECRVDDMTSSASWGTTARAHQALGELLRHPSLRPQRVVGRRKGAAPRSASPRKNSSSSGQARDKINAGWTPLPPATMRSRPTASCAS